MTACPLSIVAGATLLCLVQPLSGKYILPWFGGSPGVWTVCMLFFQLLLLAGYGYAHLTTRLLSPRAQTGLHIALLALAVASLPIMPPDSWRPAPEDDPTLRILLLLAASIGRPDFALSATGPLLQRWYSNLRGGAPPYRLYALSNAGSLLALLSYPFLIESALTRRVQADLWAGSRVGRNSSRPAKRSRSDADRYVGEDSGGAVCVPPCSRPFTLLDLPNELLGVAPGRGGHPESLLGGRCR